MGGSDISLFTGVELVLTQKVETRTAVNDPRSFSRSDTIRRGDPVSQGPIGIRAVMSSDDTIGPGLLEATVRIATAGRGTRKTSNDTAIRI
jgi:hypothetical protein